MQPAHADESEYERRCRELDAIMARITAHAQWCIEQRDWLIDLAKGQQEKREANASQDRIGAATIAKLFDTAGKYDRTATEDLHRLYEGAHDLMLTANEREMAGLGRRAH